MDYCDDVQTAPNFFVSVACGLGLVLLWRHFVDAITFSYNRPRGSVMLMQQRCCIVIHMLTPLMLGIVMSYT